MHSTSGWVTRLVGGVATAILISAVIAPIAMAAVTPRVIGSVSSAYPVSNHSVTVYARVLDVHNRPVPRVQVRFVWSLGTKNVTTYATTSKAGIASSRRVVDSRAWQRVNVAETARISGRNVSGTASFYALPRPTTAHPVTVKIGAGLPLTAGATFIGQGMLRGVQLAVAQANESSTVQTLGITFATSARDDKGSPSTAVKVANAFIADPAVLGVAGHLNSGCSIPASSVYSRGGIPMATGSSTSPDLTARGLHNVFMVTYSDDFQASAASTAARALGFSRAFVVDDSTPFGEGLAGAFSGAFTSAGGVVVETTHTAGSETDFSAVVTQIVTARPDIVYYGGFYIAGGAFSGQLHDATSTVPVIGCDGLDSPEYITLGGGNGDLCTLAGYPASQLPAGASFTASYTAMFPTATMSDYDAYSYDSANVIIQALVRQAQAGGTAWLGTRTGKAGTLAQIAATQTLGATGPIGFGPTGARLDPKFSLLKVVGGVWTYQGVY
jgi:branched-chain amino acid transport system substrate-binding protein